MRRVFAHGPASGDIGAREQAWDAGALFVEGVFLPQTAFAGQLAVIMLANGPIDVPGDSTQPHRVTLIKDGGHIRFLVDGRKIDWIDDGETYGPGLGAGKLGFRQMEGAVGVYRNLKLYEYKQHE